MNFLTFNQFKITIVALLMALVITVATGSRALATEPILANVPDGCVIPESGPWPPCATGGDPIEESSDDCILPESGPWPPCAIGGGNAESRNNGNDECVIPESGPWPPCATGEAPAGNDSSSSNDDCTIPASGPWPPCATGGNSNGADETQQDDCLIPESGPWPACATGDGADLPAPIDSPPPAPQTTPADQLKGAAAAHQITTQQIAGALDVSAGPSAVECGPFTQAFGRLADTPQVNTADFVGFEAQADRLNDLRNRIVEAAGGVNSACIDQGTPQINISTHDFERIRRNMSDLDRQLRELILNIDKTLAIYALPPIPLLDANSAGQAQGEEPYTACVAQSNTRAALGDCLLNDYIARARQLEANGPHTYRHEFFLVDSIVIAGLVIQMDAALDRMFTPAVDVAPHCAAFLRSYDIIRLWRPYRVVPELTLTEHQRFEVSVDDVLVHAGFIEPDCRGNRLPDPPWLASTTRGRMPVAIVELHAIVERVAQVLGVTLK